MEIKQAESRINENGKKGGRPASETTHQKPNGLADDKADRNPQESSPSTIHHKKEEPKNISALKAVRESEPVGFQKFWEAYPVGRGVDRKDAFRAWMKGGLELLTDQILAGLSKWIYCEQWTRDQFVPHPATFLNKRRWEAEPPREADRNRDANAGKFDPNRPVKEQTPEEIAEFKRMEIESQRWDRLEKGTLPVSAETIAWVKEKAERFTKVKLPPSDPRPRWFKDFLNRAALEKVARLPYRGWRRFVNYSRTRRALRLRMNS